MSRTTTYVAILQVAVTVFGFLALGIVLKFCGYPDGFGVRWNPLAVFLREYGIWLLIAPLFWTLFALKAQKVDRGILSGRLAMILGMCLAGLVALTFLYAAVFPYTRPFYFYFGK